MKASLYAVRMNQNWTWRASLKLEVDLAYWFHRTGGKTEMIKLDPFLSWGQAVWLSDWLNSRFKRYEKLDFNQVRGELIKALNVIKASKELMDKLALSSVEAKQGDLESASWVEAMQGRALFPNEWVDLCLEGTSSVQSGNAVDVAFKLQEAYLQGRIELSQGVKLTELRSFWRKSSELRCSRCGSGSAHMRWTHCIFCEGPCPYCESCLTMGRARFCTPLMQGIASQEKSAASLVIARPLEEWGLNAAQTNAAEVGLQFLQETAKQNTASSSPPCFLIWAVTGAGKTEMIYPLIEHELAHGRKVMVATPRKDVVLELVPRLQIAFPKHSLVALYGGSLQRWEHGDITLATTHQLIRFADGFDLVILDELDAYPYHNNPVLEFAAHKACKSQGRFIFLSATPPTLLQNKAKKNILAHIKVPVRFHRYPLPVPKLLTIQPLKQWVDKQPMPWALFKNPSSNDMTPIPAKLLEKFKQSLERGAQLFVFVSQIRNVEPLVLLLKSYFQDKVIQGTHSQDAERNEKVVDFRQTRIDILVTTTILERGITIPKTDVFVLDADAALFDEASLVQMAGRAGRSIDDPFGNVYFAGFHRTKSQVTAIKQIKHMNAIARKKGYLNMQEVKVERT